MSTSKYLHHEHQGQRFLLYLLVVPEVIFILISALFLTCFHTATLLIWGIVGVCFCAALAVTARGASMYPISTFALGLWCLLTIASAAGLGLYLNSWYLQHYHDLRTGDLSTGVDPLIEDTKAAGAAVLTFTPDTFVDDRRTIGFVAKGHIYCVAPVTRQGSPTLRVHFWAVGVDCCEKRSNFDCGTAREPTLLTAISYHSRVSHYFRDAIGVAASVYNTSSPAEAKLVGFVSDYEDIKHRLWGRAFTLLLVASFTHFLCSVLVALVSRIVGGQLLTQPGRDEAVARWVEDGCHDFQLHPSALEWETFCGCLGPRWRFCSQGPKRELLDIETWERRHKLGHDDIRFFENVFIAEDGGLRHEVKDLVHEISFFSAIFAMVTPACLLYNTIYILKTDISYLTSSTKTTVDWCIIGFVVDHLVEGLLHVMGLEASVHVPAKIVVAVLELLFLAVKYVQLIYLISEALLTKEVRRRWSNVSKIYWTVLPSLATYSAMQLLTYMVPTIVRLESMPKLQALLRSRGDEEIKAAMDLVQFVASRILFAVSGLDAFLVKFRFAMDYIAADQMSVQNLFGAFGFVLQLVGVVDLSYWNRRRLSDFVFGKADGQLSDRERADKHVYNWMLAQRMWMHSKDSVCLFSVAMLKFSDVEFQKLVLNERSKQSEGTDAADPT
mmetsp:Transcript_70453/g.206102  ORF Transcript_70453/g.206102 Transcript_70453/m.206102 type:complete len:668 (+) Transcript_70453:75-2078(+)